MIQRYVVSSQGCHNCNVNLQMVEKLERTIRSLDQQNRKLLAAAEERGDGNEAALRQQVQMLNRQLAEATQSGGSVVCMWVLAI